MVNLAKSHLNPSRTAMYLGMTLKSLSLRAFPSRERVLTLQLQLAEFLSYRQQSVVAWWSLLSLSFVSLSAGLRGHLRMRSLQLELYRQWDFKAESVMICWSWTPSNKLDLLWWSDPNHLLQGVSLEVQHPNLLFWSDASDLK